MTATKITKPAQDGTSTAFTLGMVSESVAADIAQGTYVFDAATEAAISPMPASGGSVTSLSSSAITNPTSSLSRPASAVSSSVTATSAAPCVFTWTANPLVNGQTVILGGTAVPTGFTAGVPYYVVNQATNTFQLALAPGGTGITSTSTGTAVTATLVYVSGDLIASNPIVVPSFPIQISGGGAVISRLRLKSNVTAGWGGVNLSINLWTAAPTYVNGDGGAYAVNVGAALWLGNFVIPMLQFADSAWGAGQLTGGNELALRLNSGTAVFWDIQILSTATPISGQQFILIPELLN